MANLELEYIATVLRGSLGLEPRDIAVTQLRGDASTRSYFRITMRDLLRSSESSSAPGGGRVPSSVVIMQLAEPDAIKKAEERFTSTDLPITELPYVNIQRHLAACDVAVPRIFFYDRPKGLLFLEDVGDLTMEKALKGKDRKTRRRYYRAAVDELLKIQIVGTHRRASDGENCIAFGRAFDAPLLMWECDHFLEFGVEALHGTTVEKRDREEIRRHFLRISEILAALPRCLTHRDYHSRNLMIQSAPGGSRIRVLDFQDALMGPPQYDLASLLRDSYVDVEEDLVEDLLDYYLSRWEEAGKTAGGRSDGKFRELFDLMSLQRNLKAAGRFAYIHCAKGNSRYLQYIPRTLGYVRRNLERYPELRKLHVLLATYVKELS